MTNPSGRISELLGDHGETDKLTVSILTYPPDDSAMAASPETYTLLEGSPQSLRFLANVILAHLETDACNLTLHPTAAGYAHFDPASSSGIILHTLPCIHGHYK